MTTSLAAQLQHLATITGTVGKRPKGKPSLLYAYQEAADLGNDAIYAVGLQGFEQLCCLDARFQSFAQTLFSQANLAYVREQQTAEVNAKLDASVLAFCQLLSDYFLLQPSFRALEYLIRRYKANEHNVHALMHAALPYHATNEFVRLVQVLHLEGGSSRLWEFLSPMQQTGAAMPREVLVQRCINDRALLRFVCEMAQQLSSPKQAGRVAMSFYAVVLCEALAAIKVVDEPLVTMLLPYLLKGLGPDVIADFRAATHMILTQLASKATMSAELVTALVMELCKGKAAASSLPQAFMVLAHLAATQPHLVAFPPKALKNLSKTSGAAAELAALAEKGVWLGPLLSLMLKAAPPLAMAHAGCEKLLEEIVTLVPLGAAAGPLAQAMLAEASAEGLSEGAKASLLRLLRALELRYPVELDAAVNAVLSSEGAAGDRENAGTLGASERERLFALLEVAFGGTARSPLLEAGTTLALAVDAPSAAVREMALQKLEALSLEDAGNPELAAFVQSSVLRRVQDDVPAVALAALRVGALAQAPPGPLFDALSACYHKAMRQVLQPGTSKSARREAREVVKEAIRQLSGPFLAASSSYNDQVALLLLDALPATPGTIKLSGSVLKCAARVDHPLLRGLREVKASSNDPQSPLAMKTPKKANDSKAASAAEGPGADVLLNNSMVAELAKHGAAQPEARAALLGLLRLHQRQSQQRIEMPVEGAEGQRGALLLLTVANAALRAEGGASLAGDFLKLLLAHAPAASPADKHPPTLTAEGLLQDESLARLADGTLSQHAMHPVLMLSALEVVPTEWLAQAGMEGIAGIFVAVAQQQLGEDERQLQVLVRRAAEVLPASELLSGIFALPPEAAPSVSVQVAALRMFGLTLMTPAAMPAPSKLVRGRSRAPPAGQAVKDRPMSALLHVLSTLSHPQQAVRAAGLDALHALENSLDTWWREGGLELEGAEGQEGQEGPNREQLQAVLSAVLARRAAIEADADALEALVQHTLGGGQSAAAIAPATAVRKGRAAGKKRTPMLDAEPGGPLVMALDPADVEALGRLLLGLLPAQLGPAGLHAAAVALRCVADWAPPAQLLLAAWQLLRSFVPAEQPLSGQEAELAAELLSMYVPAAVSELLGQDEQRGAEVVQALLGALGMPAQQGAASTAAVRLAALRALTPDLYAVLPEGTQREAVVALLCSASKDPAQDCRAAARAALAALPLAAPTLIPLLDIAKAPAAGGSQLAAAPTPVPKKKRGKAEVAAEPSAASEPVAVQVDAAKLELCVAVLELLQWKEDIQHAPQLVPALQATLAALLGPQSAADASGYAGPAAALPAGSYTLQLVLDALLGLARRAGQQVGAFDIGLAVRCAQAAPSGALRNAALSLVGALAAGAPQEALAYVLRVVGVVGRSAAMQSGAHSSKIASQVLGAVVPAWVVGGGSIHEVVGEVVAAAPGIPSHRRLAVFAALVDALPKVEGLCATLAALLEHALGSADDEEGQDEADAAWATDLASALLAKAPLAEQAATLAALMQHSMQSTDQQPTEPLPMLATAFASQQLQLQAGKARAASSAASDPNVAAGYEALMRAALVQLQRAGEMAAAEGRRKEKKGKKAVRALERMKAATDVTYQLLQALQRVMAPAAYLSSLAVLIGSQLDKVRRRALVLASVVVKSAAAAAAAAEKEGGQAAAGHIDKESAASLAQAALAAVQPAVQLLQPGALPAGHEPVTPITKQTALAALGTLAAAYGATSPQPFLAALPAVLSTAQDPRSAVRSSALACMAAVTRALGPRLVPGLPSVVKGVLSAAQSAAAAINAPGKGAASGEEEAEAGGSSSDDEEQPKKAAKAGVSEAAALELAAALVASSALVESLGAFMAPHLPALLHVLLAPSVLRCQAARCAELAAAARVRVAEGMPPRLLVGPLLGQLESAVEAGAPAVSALLGMLSTAVGAMDAAATASYHEPVFAFLLRALDLRRRRSATLAPPSELDDVLDEVESAAVAAFVALTLKLSESQFKPLFLRLLDWAVNAPPAGGEAGRGAGGGRMARGVALGAVVNALAERLRSVFVPYFRYLLDPFLAHLTDGSAAAPTTKKKKKKQKTGAAAEAAVDANDPLQVENDWRLRFQVVRALHRCLLYDTVKFLDEARFERLLPPLVAQLATKPPVEAAPALEALARRDAGPEAGMDHGQAAAELDVMGRAVVGCLVQLGVTAGSDALWKTLNHQVLMASRSLDPRTRLLALEAATQLAQRLREEYLVLLPETLPFLAELLEDSEAAVEARAAAVLRWLEELSGESLAEYLKA